MYYPDQSNYWVINRKCFFFFLRWIGNFLRWENKLLAFFSWHLAQSIIEFGSNPHLTGGKMKTQEEKWFAQGHIGILKMKQNQNSGYIAPCLFHYIHLNNFNYFQVLFSSSLSLCLFLFLFAVKFNNMQCSMLTQWSVAQSSEDSPSLCPKINPFIIFILISWRWILVSLECLWNPFMSLEVSVA